MLYFIYELSDPRTAIPSYIGITSNPNIRYIQHLERKTGSKKKCDWIRDLLAEGIQPKMKILETVDSKQEAQDRERHWIQQYLKQGRELTNALLVNSSERKIKSKTEIAFTIVREKEDDELTEQEMGILQRILFPYKYHLTRKKITDELIKQEHFSIPEKAFYTIHELLDGLPYKDEEIAKRCKIPIQILLDVRNGKYINGLICEQLLGYLSWMYITNLSTLNVKGI
jgi:hypothetical protein